MSKLPSALRTISWLVKPWRSTALPISRPCGSYSVSVQNRACGVVPLITTSQRPSSGRPSSSVRAKKATPSPEPTGSSPVRAIAARA